MQIEKCEGDKFKVTFEPIPALDFHEQPAVMSALGSYLVMHRADIAVRTATAEVAAMLMPLKTSNEDNQRIDTEPISLNTEQLAVLQNALYSYTDENLLQGDIVAAAMGGNFRNSIVRTIEAGFALTMLEKIAPEIGEINPAMNDHPVGYISQQTQS